MPQHGTPDDPHGLNQIAINRPFKAWDFELTSPMWRRWFDTLKEQGVTNLSDAAIGEIQDKPAGRTIHDLPARASLFEEPQTTSQYQEATRFNPGGLTAGKRALEGLQAYDKRPSRVTKKVRGF